MTKITIDPVSRISGLLEIEVEIENNVIVDAKSSGMQFRGFEEMFRNRSPLDMPRLTSRTCGICSTHHASASSMALEDAFGIKPEPNGFMVRELTNGYEFLQNHLRHIYQFAFPDYVDLGEITPLQKNIDKEAADYRLPKDINDKIASHYLESIQYSRNAHKAVAILAGKAPHCHGIFIGGTTTNLDIQKYQEVKVIVHDIKKFIENNLIPDIYTVAKYYSDYFSMGKGYGNLMTNDLFNYEFNPVKYVSNGVIINGRKENLDPDNITESVKYTWASAPNNIVLPGQNPAKPDENKKGAYSWVNAARYKGYAMEVGPLARMIIGGYYDNGISAMDRLIARVLEAKKVCEVIEGLLEVVRLQPANQKQWEIPKKASGMALVGATRGVLGHWIEVEDSVVKNYTLIPPSSWNLSPKDDRGLRGPVEEALVGTRIDDMKKAPTVIGRIVRSFDPCLNCAAHITSDTHSPFTIKIV